MTRRTSLLPPRCGPGVIIHLGPLTLCLVARPPKASDEYQQAIVECGSLVAEGGDGVHVGSLLGRPDAEEDAYRRRKQKRVDH